jgi:predicted transcriptional regulator
VSRPTGLRTHLAPFTQGFRACGVPGLRRLCASWGDSARLVRPAGPGLCRLEKNKKDLTSLSSIVNDNGRMKIYSSAQAAKQLGLTPAAITKYIKAGKISAPKMMEGVNRHIWTEQDVERVRKLLPKIANGRKTRYQKVREKQKTQARAPALHKKKQTKKKK